jgi:hypothetical protein
MRKLVEARLDRYQVAAFKDKSLLACEVVHEVKDCGGRFLKKRLNGLFVEVDDETCHKKVSIAFRDLMKKSRQYQDIFEERLYARKQKLGPAETNFDQDEKFELLAQQQQQQHLESEATPFLDLSREGRKRHKGFDSEKLGCSQ